jgi:signal peptide peptidase SppA
MLKKQPGTFQKIVKKFKKSTPLVSVIRLEGVIGSAGSFKKGLTLEDQQADISKAFKPKNLKAVALQINSPGGSPVQSELIFNLIRELSEEKGVPVFSFVEDVAASGGYWLACAGDEIYSLESSIVGSIGVISSGFGFVEAIKKLGVERRVYTQGENKSILDPFKPEKPDDVEFLKSLQSDIHESFKNLVRTRRKGKIDEDANNKIFTGQFWNGVKAKELGLIDSYGSMDAVLKEKFGKDVKIERIAKPKSWLKKKLSGASLSLVESCVKVVDEKSLWSKYNL